MRLEKDVISKAIIFIPTIIYDSDDRYERRLMFYWLVFTIGISWIKKKK